MVVLFQKRQRASASFSDLRAFPLPFIFAPSGAAIWPFTDNLESQGQCLAALQVEVGYFRPSPSSFLPQSCRSSQEVCNSHPKFFNIALCPPTSLLTPSIFSDSFFPVVTQFSVPFPGILFLVLDLYSHQWYKTRNLSPHLTLLQSERVKLQLSTSSLS